MRSHLRLRSRRRGRHDRGGGQGHLLAVGLLSLCLPRAARADFDECLQRHSHDAADATCCVGDNMPCVVEQNGRRLEEALPSGRRKLGHCCDRELFCQCMEGQDTCSDAQRSSPGCPGPAQSSFCEMRVGDGVGGSEDYVGDAGSANECAMMVLREEPDANGATYPAPGEGTRCYAEFDMTHISTAASGWQTCRFNEERCPAAPEALPFALQTGSGAGLAAGWRRLFRQTAGSYRSAEDWLSYNPGGDSTGSDFSALDQLESCRQQDGKLHMKLVWPELENTQEWKQTTNPVTDRGSVEGYEAVAVNFHGNHWGGLEHNGGSSSLLDGSVGVDNWWYAVGSSTPHHGAIPGPDTTVVQVTELHAFCGASTEERAGAAVPLLPPQLFSRSFVTPLPWEFLAFVSDRPGYLTLSGTNPARIPLLGVQAQHNAQPGSTATIHGPSGSACCGQPRIELECPAGQVIVSGQISGTCCSESCRRGATECSCDSCDTNQDEHWESSIVCQFPEHATAASTCAAGTVPVRCGNAGSCGEEDYCASPNERHEVTCCSDNDLGGWASCTFDGRMVWAERDAGELECTEDVTLAEAEATCAAVGARLCTVEELEANCGQGTGCMHDGKCQAAGICIGIH